MEFRKEQTREVATSGLSPERREKGEVLEISIPGHQNSRAERNLEQKHLLRKENAFGQSKLNT